VKLIKELSMAFRERGFHGPRKMALSNQEKGCPTAAQRLRSTAGASCFFWNLRQ
jgi:hypothetical protein